MTRDYFVFEVFSEVRLTRPELRELLQCSRSHYDHTCKALSQQGGLLFGWRFWFDDDEAAFDSNPDETESKPMKLSSRQLDLLVKVTELPATPLAATLHIQLRMLLIEASNAYRKVNEHLVDSPTPTWTTT